MENDKPERRKIFSFLRLKKKDGTKKSPRVIRRSDVRAIMTAVIFMILTLLLKGHWDLDSLETSYAKFKGNIIEYQWYQIESVFEGKYRQAFDNSTILANDISTGINTYYSHYHYSQMLSETDYTPSAGEYSLTNVDFSEKIREDLENLDVDNHPIINIISGVLKDQFFDGIVNDANDPFVTILGDTPLIVADTSLNCSAVGRTRTFEEEYPMHSNLELAKTAFTRIQVMDTPDWKNNIFENPIFFQFVDHPKGTLVKEEYPEDSVYYEFNGKMAYELDYYDLNGLRDAFLKTEGNWKEIFATFEFIAPAYIYDFEDLSGVPRVNDRGMKQDSKIIAVNTVFNFKDVLNNMPREREKLITYEKDLDNLKEWYVKEQRFILSVSLLALILALMVLATTVRLTSGG